MLLLKGYFFMIKVVIDTNTLINASGDDYNFGNRIVDAVLDDKIEAYANVSTMRENRFLSQQKITDLAYQEKLQKYFDKLKSVEGRSGVNIVEDREDNKILDSAVTAGVDYLITSDWHLLKIGEHEGVKIVRPEAFWAEYETESGEGWQNWLKTFIE